MDEELLPKNGAPKPGRARGGAARAKALPAKRRSEIAKKGAAARWDPEIRKVQAGDEDHPLVIGGVKMSCYVLEDGERVLSQRGFFDVFGIRSGGRAMQRLIDQAQLEKYLSPETIEELRKPLRMQ